MPAAHMINVLIGRPVIFVGRVERFAPVVSARAKRLPVSPVRHTEAKANIYGLMLMRQAKASDLLTVIEGTV